MPQQATRTVGVEVMDYRTGRRLGRAPMLATAWRSYDQGRHSGFQWPAGIARAGDVLTEAELAALAGATAETIIYLE